MSGEVINPLWRVASHGCERRWPGRPYWFDNTDRSPEQHVCLQYTVRGSMTFRDAAGHDHEVPHGHALLFGYREPTAYGLTARHTQMYQPRWLNLGGAGLVEHWSAIRARFGSIFDFSNDPSFEPELIELANMCDPHRAVSPTAMASAVHQFVMRLYDRAERARRADQSAVHQAIDNMLQQPTLAWSLKQIASRHGCSREHLCRVFRQRVGQSPGRFLNQARLRHAVRLLRETDLSVDAVARQSGFLSVHTLRRQLRRRHQRTPTMLRDALQKVASADQSA